MNNEPVFTNPKTATLWRKAQPSGFGLYFLSDKAVLWADVEGERHERLWYWAKGTIVPAKLDGIKPYSNADDAMIDCEKASGYR